MHENTQAITALIERAAQRARRESRNIPDPDGTVRIDWPVSCTVGPGLEGAIACETKIGFVNGAKGSLIYCGYDIFDLCAYSSYEEVCYLLLHGRLPNEKQLAAFKKKLFDLMWVPQTLRMMMSFPLEEMHPMAALRLGTNLLRQRVTWRDWDTARPDRLNAIASDEDSIPMETLPHGESHAIYEFPRAHRARPNDAGAKKEDAFSRRSCMHVIAAMATIAAGVSRIRQDLLPIEPDPELGHAANFLYMMSGERPTPEQARIMDVALILHADHGMNASTFAAMVVASTMSDVYLSTGSGVAALSGPLHGGANEQVVYDLQRIGGPENVEAWFKRTMRQKRRIMGFGHRVYKAYDPRARVLGPLAAYQARHCKRARTLYTTASALERLAMATLSEEKKIFPNVDFYSGIVYSGMGIPVDMFTPIFAVSRAAGWTARVLEYLRKNRIFRPRAWYTGEFAKTYKPLDER